MKFSASAINDLTKCGYMYYLKRVQGLAEPGKKSYNIVQGDVVGSAIQYCAVILNKRKELSVETIAKVLYAMYVKYYYQAEITPCLLVHIRSILLDGLSEEAMMACDDLSHAINSTRYEFKVPARLKGGKLSYNKAKLPLPLRVTQTMEDVLWFFTSSGFADKIRDAAAIECEKYFELYLGTHTVTVNGKTVDEVDVVHGYLDMRIVNHDGPADILELKYTSTAYTPELVNILNQVVTYQIAHAEDRVHLIDVKRNRCIQAAVKPDIASNILRRYNLMRSILEQQIYIPVCGTDPYNTSKVLCGYKCGGCPYATGEGADEEPSE